MDPDSDKAVGGRLVPRHSGEINTALGSSFYVGSFEQESRTISTNNVADDEWAAL